MNFRLTKYNPAFRNEEGFYPVDEWTVVSDIGRAYAGVRLSAEEYVNVESAYVRGLLSFCRHCGLAGLTIDGLEMIEPNRCEGSFPCLAPIARGTELSEGAFVPVADLDSLIRLILREEVWCRLLGDFESYIHFGYDYYSYLGSAALQDTAFMQEPLLFIEPFESPYHREEEA